MISASTSILSRSQETLGFLTEANASVINILYKGAFVASASAGGQGLSTDLDNVTLQIWQQAQILNGLLKTIAQQQ